MAIGVTNLGASSGGTATNPDLNDNVDRTSYANSAWTPPSADDCIILCWVYNTRATNLGSAPTLSGNNLTWTNIATNGVDPGAQTHRLTLYAAISTGTATAGATTASFAGDTQSSLIMSFQQVTGVDLTGGLSGAIVQKPTNTTAANTTLTVTLSVASDANNRFIVGMGHGQPETVTPESGWDTTLDDIWGTSPGHALQTYWDSDSVADITPNATWSTSGAAVGIAIEVKAAAEPAPPVVVTASKGYVATHDFPASPVSASSYKASNAGTSDFSVNSASATSLKTNNADTSDSSSSNVEASDL